MDLLGMEVQRRRREQKFTVLNCLTDCEEWTMVDIEKLGAAISPGTELYSHPRYPTSLILFGEVKREEICRVLGHDNFQYKVVQGYDSSELPFTPPN